MPTKHCVYWLVHDGDLFEDHSEFISVKNVEITPAFNQRQIKFGRSPLADIWPREVVVFITGSEPVDYLLCTPYLDLVSEAAKQVIEDIARIEVEFLPIEIKYENGKPYCEMRYWALNVLSVVDALDWNRTVWAKPSPPLAGDPMAALSIIKPCFQIHKIKDSQIFRSEVAGRITGSKYLSSELKEALEQANRTTGMEFSPIKTV